VTAPAADPARRDDLRVAHVHLRLGQLTLARAELEELLGADGLDLAGLAALAEARWRTGDPNGAADAAFAHLDAGGSDDVALCIAAETVAAEGRPDEARTYMDRLPAADAATLDMLFAGMPRRAFWPAGPVDRSDLDELRRATAPGTMARPAAPGAPAAAVPASPLSPAAASVATAPQGAPGAATAAEGTPGASGVRTVPGPQQVMEAMTAQGWEVAAGRAAEGLPSQARAAGEPARPRRVKGQLDPAAELERARRELGIRPERALLRLSLVLRHDPTYAPAVLELLHLRRDPMAALVRGDAQRLLGRHLEAEAAFDSAAETLEAP
jgi:tetratricopeptide (TPR) repeat protein